MNLWQRLPLILLLGMGMLCLGIGCGDDNNPAEPPPAPEGHLTLGNHLLDFGEGDNEKTVLITNDGDTSLTWNISASSIPYWATVNPFSGTLASSAQIRDTVRVYRVGIGPGTTTATLTFLSSANDDTLLLSVDHTCDLLGDNFNSGSAANWTATALTPSQGEGYVVLVPTSTQEAGRLLQHRSPVFPCVVSARFGRTGPDADLNQYGILLEGTDTQDALEFTIYADSDTMNYALEQHAVGWTDWERLAWGLTGLISTAPGQFSILRLELYQSGQIVYARGYAGIATEPLFEGVEIEQSLDFVKMGLRTEGPIVNADWFCAAH